jgi:hypothetical protein
MAIRKEPPKIQLGSETGLSTPLVLGCWESSLFVHLGLLIQYRSWLKQTDLEKSFEQHLVTGLVKLIQRQHWLIQTELEKLFQQRLVTGLVKLMQSRNWLIQTELEK